LAATTPLTKTDTRPPFSQVIAFIEDHRAEFGVEPMCKMLQIAASTYCERRAIARDPDRASARAKSDADLCAKIDAASKDNRKLYGARKVGVQNMGSVS
jgi:putative transposase